MTPSIAPLLAPGAVRRTARAVERAFRASPVWQIGVRLDPDLATIIAKVAAGDQVAFASLYDQLAPTLFGVVRRVLRDPSQAEEVTQEVFVEIWKQAARFDGDAGLGPDVGRHDRPPPGGRPCAQRAGPPRPPAAHRRRRAGRRADAGGHRASRSEDRRRARAAMAALVRARSARRSSWRSTRA